jgi:hypothetical protein
MNEDNKPIRTRAGDVLLTAARLRSEAALNARMGRSDCGDRRRAEELELAVSETPPAAMTERGASGELIPVNCFGYRAAPGLRDTVEHPNHVTVDASRDRLELANQASILDLALDTADTVQARDSIERMLCHQLAAAHRAAMKLTAQLNREIEGLECKIGYANREPHNLHAGRLAASVARMMAAFNDGAMTLQRLRTGGRQVVQVQHVQVNSGGQAVVTGKLTTGRGGRRRGRKSK